ncbi:hypothetical protein KBC75_02215 [Candidatus Shapirobacteria bacterium]|nr:hypothetical protein [Candidatus Shapirobacteria bacterium]
MKLKKLTFLISAVMVGMLVSPVEAIAAPHFSLTPATTSVANGSQFDVVLGVDSGTEKVIGIDVAATFDSSKLEVVSIQKATIPDGGYNFTYTSSSPIIKNDVGKFEITLPSANSSVYEGVVANHDLLKITFRAKNTGVATVNLTCTPGSVTESNIINQSGADVVDCTSNQSGSYTITASSTTDTTVTTAPTPTTTSNSSTTTTTTTTSTSGSTELPRTGSVETTVIVMVVGLMSVIAGAVMRIL